jgi:hypothetical protein
MAGFFQEFIQGVESGFFGVNYLRDYQHASKIFTTNAYANAPKFKWLFHVYFDINKTLVSSNPNIFPADEIPGLLVKNINLPKYSISLSEMNQYNRKRYVQTKLTYDPITVTFHDDNAGAIRQLWYDYFSYYYYDTNNPLKQAATAGSPGRAGSQLSQSVTELNRKTTYSPDISQNAQWGYLGEPSTSNSAQSLGMAKAPFFKSIKVFGFNQHSFALYDIVNPIIERFEHDTYDYYQTTGTMENRMTIRYETVKYGQGALNGRNPSAIVNGFGLEGEYDTTPSPIMIPGANRNILGQGGVLDAGLGVVSDLSNGNVIGAVQKIGTTINTFKNPQNLLQTAKAELVTGVFNATQNPQTLRNVFSFPTTSSTSGRTAQQISTGSPGGSQEGFNFNDQGQFL